MSGSSVSHKGTKSLGSVVPVFLHESQCNQGSFNLHRGKLSWEIKYKKSRVLEPDARLLLWWRTFLLLLVLFHAWVVPLLLCVAILSPSICTDSSLHIVAQAVDVFFTVDMFVQMRTGYYVLGNLVRNESAARRRYLYSTDFGLDLIALIPLTLLDLYLKKLRCGVSLVNKLIRLRKLANYTLDFDKVFARYFTFCKVIKVAWVSFFFCHYLACTYVAFGVAHKDDDGDWIVEDVWKLRVHNDGENHHVLRNYFAAFFWSLGLVSKCLEGETPRTLLQTLFMLVVMTGGFLLFVYICGTLFMISKCDTYNAEKIDAKIHQLRHILSFHSVPDDIQGRAFEYLENFYKSGDINDRSTTKLFCPSISKDLNFTHLKEMVSNVPFFKCCSNPFIRALIDLMEPQSLPANFIVYKCGDVEEDMYFIQCGVLAVLINGLKVKEFRKGSFFGELSLFLDNPRTTSVATTTYCLLYRLTRTNVQRVLRAYPQFENQIMTCTKQLALEQQAEVNELSKRGLSKQELFAQSKSSWTFLRDHLGSAKRKAEDSNAESSMLHLNSQDSNTSDDRRSQRRRSSSRFVSFMPQASSLDGSRTLLPDKRRKRNILTKGISWVQKNWTKILLARAIHRKSKLRLIWVSVMTIVTFYNVVAIPLLNVFRLMGYPNSILVINTIVDAILCLDMYGKLNLSFVVEAEPIFDTRKCAVHYYKTAFWFDFVCAFPLWILYPSQHLILRISRLFRVYHVKEELEEIAMFININGRRRIILLGLGIFLCAHIAGCLAHSLTLFVGYDENEHGWLPPITLYLEPIYRSSKLIGYEYMKGSKFVTPDDPMVLKICVLQYLRALQYGAVSLTSLGKILEPESFGEFVIASYLMLCGLLLISTIIDEVQKRVTASAVDQMEFLSTRSRVMHFLHKQKAPVSIQQRVASYMDFWWSVHRGANVNSLLGELPQSIKREVLLSICSPLLVIVEQMGDVDAMYEAISHALVDNVTIYLFGQGEYIYRKGDFADGLYVLLVGDVALTPSIRTSKAQPQRYVKAGGVFGCSCLYLESESVAFSETAFAQTACVVAFIERSTLVTINCIFPTFCENILHIEHKQLVEHRAMVRLLEQKELQQIRAGKPKGIINPTSNWSLAWETFLFINMAAQMVSLPYFLAFGFDWTGVGAYDYITIIQEICFIVDIYIKSITAFDHYGNKVVDKRLIRKRYFRSARFVLDILSALPFNLVNLIQSPRSEVWNMNKLLRLVTISMQVDHLERHYVTLNMHIRVLKLILYIYLLAHYIGCTWYNFASNSSIVFGFIREPQFGNNSWLPGTDMDMVNENTSRVILVMRTLFWGLGLLIGYNKGGFPHSPLEYIFTLCIQTLGVFLLAYVVGNLLDIVQGMEGNNRLFYSNLNYVRKIIHYFKFSSEVTQKIQDFYFYRVCHSIHEEYVLSQCLPPSLVADIRHFLLMPVLSKVPFFQGESVKSNVTRSLVRQLVQVLVSRHEVVCRQNEVGTEMYFVFTGCLEVFVASNAEELGTENRRGTKVNEIYAGSFFGEKSLFSDQPRNASIEAKTFCTLFKLSRKHLESVFQQYPEWKDRVIQIANVIYELQAKAQVKYSEDHRHHEVKIDRSRSRSRKSGLSIHNISSINDEDNVEAEPWTKSWKKIVLSPTVQSSFYRAFLMIRFGCLLYVAIHVPYAMTFGHANQANAFTVLALIFDIASDLVFAYNIWFKMHLVESSLSAEFYEHRVHYDSIHLWLDIVAILPIDYAFSSFVHRGAGLRLNRLITLKELAHTINEIHRFSMTYELNRLKLLGLYYILICHWTACSYFGLTFILGFSEKWEAALPFEYFNSSLHGDTFDFAFSWHQYLRCLYCALNLYTGIGLVYEPTSALHFTFHFIMCVFGVFIMGYIIGEASTLSIYIIQNEVDFKINQMHVIEFLSRRRVDNVLRNRIHNFMTYWWTYQAGVNHQEIMEQLPSRIRAQAFIEIGRSSLSRFALKYIRPLVHPLSSNVDVVMHRIAQRLVFAGFPSGESVIVQGNIGHKMYFVSSGTLITASITPNFKSSRYEKGDFFGEEGFLCGAFCSYSVVTLCGCDLLALSAEDFIAALNEDVQTSLCFELAKDAVETHGDVRSIGPTAVGKLICRVVHNNISKYDLLSALREDSASIMFTPILNLFARQYHVSTPPYSSSDGTDTCQHCELSRAHVVCKLCNQALCQPCSDSIHKNTHFSFHLIHISTPPHLVRSFSHTGMPRRRSSLQNIYDKLVRRKKSDFIPRRHSLFTKLAGRRSIVSMPWQKSIRRIPLLLQRIRKPSSVGPTFVSSDASFLPQRNDATQMNTTESSGKGIMKQSLRHQSIPNAQKPPSSHLRLRDTGMNFGPHDFDIKATKPVDPSAAHERCENLELRCMSSDAEALREIKN